MGRHFARIGRREPDRFHFKEVGPVAFDERGLDKHIEEHRAQQGGGRIRCPHCDWQPRKASRWVCWSVGAPEHYASGCGQSWNTFDTRGQCPGCYHNWSNTLCLKCSQWAAHADWYV